MIQPSKILNGICRIEPDILFWMADEHGTRGHKDVHDAVQARTTTQYHHSASVFSRTGTNTLINCHSNRGYLYHSTSPVSSQEPIILHTSG